MRQRGMCIAEAACSARPHQNDAGQGVAASHATMRCGPELPALILESSCWHTCRRSTHVVVPCLCAWRRASLKDPTRPVTPADFGRQLFSASSDFQNRPASSYGVPSRCGAAVTSCAVARGRGVRCTLGLTCAVPLKLALLLKCVALYPAAASAFPPPTRTQQALLHRGGPEACPAQAGPTGQQARWGGGAGVHVFSSVGAEMGPCIHNELRQGVSCSCPPRAGLSARCVRARLWNGGPSCILDLP